MTTDTGAALLAIVRANPTDWDARRVYADWLDDGSEEGAIAANGQRWQAENEKCTIPMASGAMGIRSNSYDWWVTKRVEDHDTIENSIWDKLTEYAYIGITYKEYHTPDAAEAALARALWALGIQAT